MEDEQKQALIKLCDERKGKKGRFLYLLREYHNLIFDMHNDNKTTVIIGDAIEKDLNHTIRDSDKSLLDPRQTFYRAIDRYIKDKLKGSKVIKKKSVVISKPEIKPEATFSEYPRLKLNDKKRKIPNLDHIDKSHTKKQPSDVHSQKQADEA